MNNTLKIKTNQLQYTNVCEENNKISLNRYE